jgi:hypothetical protein
MTYVKFIQTRQLMTFYINSTTIIGKHYFFQNKNKASIIVRKFLCFVGNISDRMNGWMHVFNCVWVGDRHMPIVFTFHIFLGFILIME